MKSSRFECKLDETLDWRGTRTFSIGAQIREPKERKRNVEMLLTLDGNELQRDEESWI